MKCFKNKVYGLILIAIGFVPVLIDGDYTALVLFGVIGLGLIFAKENWIV